MNPSEPTPAGDKETSAAESNSPEQSPYFTVKPELDNQTIKERSFDLYRLFQISQVRESALPQFDGMGYSRWNETNEMTDMSFLAPKKNKGDTRITTGITHEKDNDLVSFYMNLNFEWNLRVFYKDQEMEDLGTSLTKLARKTREIEGWDAKRPLFYKNITVQGTSFALEEYEENWVPDKVITSGAVDMTDLDSVTWIDKGLKKVSQGCVSNLADGKKVFLEDIRQWDIQKQPGAYIVDYVPREIMASVWGKTKRWKNVPYFVTPTAQSLGTLTQGSIYSDWIWGEIDFNKVERIRVFRPFEQRFQVYLNGVPMLKAKFPLKAVSPSGMIPIAKGDADIMNLFAYSKSEPSKTKIDQAVFDELLQNMVMKSRQSAMVPRANNSGRALTPDMFLGGRIVSNLNVQDVPPLIENPGITAQDFSFYKLFQEQISNKTVTSLMEQGYASDQPSKSVEEYMDQEKKHMLKVASKIDGIMQWEKQMLKLRVADILVHGAEEDEESETGYKTVTAHDSMSDGTKGLNIIKFMNPNPKTSEDVFEEQNDYYQKNGKKAEISYMNPELMKAILEDDDFYICYEVIPTDKNNDTLTKMVFVKMITDAVALFGPDSIRVAKLKKQYAAKMGVSYDDLFLSEQELQQKQQQAMLAGGGMPGAVKSPLQNFTSNQKIIS